MAGLLNDLVNMGRALIGDHPSPQQQQAQNAGRVVQAITNPYSYMPHVPMQPQVMAHQVQQVPQLVAPSTQPLQYMIQGNTFNPGDIPLQSGNSYGQTIQPQRDQLLQGQNNWNI